MATTPAPVTASADPAERLKLADGHGAIIGLQWGDEGKGQIVDVLTPRYDLVVRYNGGANAGHSVHIGGEKFALHLLPSGILNPRKLSVIANGVVLDPQVILEEIAALAERGIQVGDNLRISDRAHVVFPYHKLQDILMEQAVGAARGDRKKIGTTARGIGPAYADKALRSTAIRVWELLEPDHLREKLAYIVKIKNALLASLAQFCGEDFDPIDADALTRQYLTYGQALRTHICDTTELLHRSAASGKKILFEGANACLLDVDHGTYPFATSSNCSSLGIYAGSGMPPNAPGMPGMGSIIGVVKTYTSRVGGGPMPTELSDEIGDRIRQVGNEFGTTTGRPRRCGWLDLMAVRYSANLSGVSAIACTGLAVLAGIEKLNVCVGYRHKGKALQAFPASPTILDEVQPVYETLDGYIDPIDHCQTFQDLPKQTRDYIRFIEQFVGVPVAMVCVGRRRDQILFP